MALKANTSNLKVMSGSRVTEKTASELVMLNLMKKKKNENTVKVYILDLTSFKNTIMLSKPKFEYI